MLIKFSHMFGDLYRPFSAVKGKIQSLPSLQCRMLYKIYVSRKRDENIYHHMLEDHC